MTALKIAHIGPVATSIPPPKSGSVEQMTSLLTEGLVSRGVDVTLFATADSLTRARLLGTAGRPASHRVRVAARQRTNPPVLGTDRPRPTGAVAPDPRLAVAPG